MLIRTQKVKLERWHYSNCSERQLWLNGYYYVKKYADMDSDRKKTDGLTFIAVLYEGDDPNENSIVDIAVVSATRGEIVNIEFLKDKYLLCGVEETLVKLVLQDTDVNANGGLMKRIGLIDSFHINIAPKDYLKEARSECKSMIHLYNKREREAYDYLKATQEANFGVLYVADDANHMCAMSIGRALREYRTQRHGDIHYQEWSTFNSNWPSGYGRFWYFCKCQNVKCKFYDYDTNSNVERKC